MGDEEAAPQSRIYCRMGDVELTVEGSDDEWVHETFEEEWAERLEEAGQMKDAVREADRGCL